MLYFTSDEMHLGRNVKIVCKMFIRYRELTQSCILKLWFHYNVY